MIHSLLALLALAARQPAPQPPLQPHTWGATGSGGAGGYSAVRTGMPVTKRDRTPHHGVGVKPTVPVSPTLRGFKEGRDEVLEKALRIVGTSAM